MKKLTPTAAALVLLLVSNPAAADWSANIGWVSDYHFRGIFQSDSSTSAGVDFEQNGFYAGTWAADVDDGLEIDGYFGYGGDYGDFGYSIGFTGYYYTGDFDDAYQEINLGGSYAIASLNVAIGEYENFAGPTQDYTFVSLTVEHNGFYGTLGSFTQDFNGDYLEIGYGTTVAEIDIGVSLVLADDDLVGTGDDDGSFFFSVGKSFDL